MQLSELNFITGSYSFFCRRFFLIIDKYFVIMGRKIYRWFPFCKGEQCHRQCNGADEMCSVRKQSCLSFTINLLWSACFFFGVKFMKIDTMTTKYYYRVQKKMETMATTNSHLKALVASVNCRQKVSACAKNSSIAPNIMSCVFILQANEEKNMQGGWIELKICMIPAFFKASCFSIWPILISVSLRKTACDTKISLSIGFGQPTVLLLFAFLANVTQFLPFPLTFFCSTQKNAVINSWWDVSSE